MLCFNCGEKEIWSNMKEYQNIVAMVVDVMVFFQEII